MWNDHWSIMKPAYFIIWVSFNNSFRFSIKWYSRVDSKKMWSTPAVWKQYNKMAVLHFFLINSPLIYMIEIKNCKWLILLGRIFFTLDNAKTAHEAMFLTDLRWWFQLKRLIFTSSSYSIYVFIIYEKFKRGDICIFFFFSGFRRIQRWLVCFKPIFKFREFKIRQIVWVCKLFEESCSVVSSCLFTIFTIFTWRIYIFFK